MVENIISLLVGLATFIIGMNMMSSGMKKATGKGVKSLFKKTQNNRFAGMGIGAAVTALIQSSDATAIMAIGFISVGVMTVFQGVAVIMGGYIGTTITGIIVSLSSVSFSKYFVLLAVIGVAMRYFKNQKVKAIGDILAGLGLLFFGLSTTTSAFKVNGVGTELLDSFREFFTTIEKISINPLLFFIVGFIITAIIQSSSATSGIVIIMVGGGAISLTSGLYLVLGASVGTVITTLLASIDGNINVKRTAFICLFIKLVTGLLGLAVVWPLEASGNLLSNFLTSTFTTNELGLAIFQVLFNVFFMFALVPFINPIIKLFEKLIKDKDAEKQKQVLLYIDDYMLKNPALAMMQVNKEIVHMYDLACDNYKRGYNALIKSDLSEEKLINETETNIDYINNAITSFLITLSNSVSLKDEKLIGSYFHIINDIERIGDHASNFLDNTIKMKEKDLLFSEIDVSEFDDMNSKVIKMFELSKQTLINLDTSEISLIHSLEDETDKLKLVYSGAHYDRLSNKKCHVELSPFYSTLISELERVADHLVNIGYAFANPTGDDEEQ